MPKPDESRRLPQQNDHSNHVFQEPTYKRTYPTQQHPKYFGPSPPKRQRFEGRSEKFEAFGKFLSTSLCDLPENRALELIQKFTNELVKTFLIPNEKPKDKKVPMVTIQNASTGNATVKTNGHSNQNGVEMDESTDDDEEDPEDDVQII